MNPSHNKWVFRNDCTKGVIESYISDLPSLIPKADDKTAFKLLEALHMEFDKKNDILKVNTMCRLCTALPRCYVLAP